LVGGTVKFPDVREFDERVYENDPTTATPTVTTGTAGSITTSSAAISGNSWACSGSCTVNPTSEGTCYGTSPNPTTPCTSDGTSTPFNSSLTGLTRNTLYYYRAFATNSAGTAYGTDLSFTTLNVFVGPPTSVMAGFPTPRVTLSWGASTTEGVDYTVDRALSATGPFSQLKGGIAELSYTDTKVARGDDYWYKVRAYLLNCSKDCNSVWSSVVEANCCP
jgi:hypothetical protein